MCTTHCWSSCKLSHITLHSATIHCDGRCIVCSPLIKPGDCMTVCGLIILFVELPTSYLPTGHNAGLFIKYKKLLWTVCNYTTPQSGLMWAAKIRNLHDSSDFIWLKHLFVEHFLCQTAVDPTALYVMSLIDCFVCWCTIMRVITNYKLNNLLWINKRNITFRLILYFILYIITCC